MPYQASRRGGRSRHGHTLRNGIAALAAVVQPQRSQRHAEPLARTWKRRFRAHAPRCRCARAARHRPPAIGGQGPPPGKRPDRPAPRPAAVGPLLHPRGTTRRGASGHRPLPSCSGTTFGNVGPMICSHPGSCSVPVGQRSDWPSLGRPARFLAVNWLHQLESRSILSIPLRQVSA